MLTDLFTNRDPFAQMDDWVRKIDGLAHTDSGLTVREEDDAYVLTADVPGLTPEQLEVTLEGDVLAVSAREESPETGDHAGWTRVRTERPKVAIDRRLRFRRPIDGDRIAATLEEGQLKVVLPTRGPTTLTIPVTHA